MRNRYTVTNVMDVWECDLLDVQSLAKYNDTHRYILSVINVFSKYLHLFPVETESGPFNASAFRSIFHDDDLRRPVWYRTDKGKYFINKHLQMCKNPYVKCVVGERTHRMIRDRL